MKSKRKRIVSIVIWLLVCTIGLPLLLYGGINLYVRFSNADRLYSLKEAESISERADVILVLGAGVRPDGSPSNMLEDRLLTALQLYELGVSDKILVSGDHGTKYYDEVNVMKSYLMGKGIPSERIFMDHAGFSTYDSVYRAKEIFGAKSAVIVTQEYHSYRTMMIAKHLDLDAVGVFAPILSSDAEEYPKQSWYSFRETLARVKDFFYCVVKPEPTCLGERIPLDGSGDVTNDVNS